MDDNNVFLDHVKTGANEMELYRFFYLWVDAVFSYKVGQLDLIKSGKEKLDIAIEHLKNAEKSYGKIEYLSNKGNVGETMYFKDKKSFEKEIHDSNEIGRPINPVKVIDNEDERER